MLLHITIYNASGINSMLFTPKALHITHLQRIGYQSDAPYCTEGPTCNKLQRIGYSRGFLLPSLPLLSLMLLLDHDTDSTVHFENISTWIVMVHLVKINQHMRNNEQVRFLLLLSEELSLSHDK
jgi:hypothetical protein